MTSLSTTQPRGKKDFAVITDSFLHDPGLPCASILDRETIEQVFREEETLFGQDDIYSTQIVLWAFLAQMLRDGKGAACAAAVADIATHMIQTGQRPPSGNTATRGQSSDLGSRAPEASDSGHPESEN